MLAGRFLTVVSCDSPQKPAREPAMDAVKFIALDKEDLEVVSAHLQDAEIKVADVHWRPGEKRLVLAGDRFDWPAADSPGPQLRRRRAALPFGARLALSCKKWNP